MKFSILTITLCSVAFATAGCNKKSADSGSGSATTTGSGSATATGSGSAAPTAAAGKDELSSATWKRNDKPGKLDAPLAFDRQVYSDDGNGNLQIFLVGKCAKGPEVCALLKYNNLQHEDLDKVCPGWSMVHIVFNPKQGDQKAGMGALKIAPGKFGTKSVPIALGMVEYTDKNDGTAPTVGGQIYQDTPNVELTQVGATIAGTFDSKNGDFSAKGSFTAKQCVCDPNTPVCK